MGLFGGPPSPPPPPSGIPPHNHNKGPFYLSLKPYNLYECTCQPDSHDLHLRLLIYYLTFSLSVTHRHMLIGHWATPRLIRTKKDQSNLTMCLYLSKPNQWAWDLRQKQSVVKSTEIWAIYCIFNMTYLSYQRCENDWFNSIWFYSSNSRWELCPVYSEMWTYVCSVWEKHCILGGIPQIQLLREISKPVQPQNKYPFPQVKKILSNLLIGTLHADRYLQCTDCDHSFQVDYVTSTVNLLCTFSHFELVLTA